MPAQDDTVICIIHHLSTELAGRNTARDYRENVELLNQQWHRGLRLDLGPLTQLINFCTVCLSLAADVAFFFAIHRSTASPPKWVMIIYLALRGAVFLLALPSTILGYESFKTLFISSGLYFTLNYVRIPLWLGNQACLLYLLAKLKRSDGHGAEAAVPSTTRSSSQRDLVVGGLWLVGGLVVTLFSYSAAAGGGRYVVTVGAIAYGLLRIVRGLSKGSYQLAGPLEREPIHKEKSVSEE